MSVNGESSQILAVPRGKRILLRVCAIALLALGVLPSPVASLFLYSILPLLGGLYLAFIAYSLLKWSSLVLEIGPDGVSLENRKHRRLTPWSEIAGFSQGSGIDRYRVTMTLVSDPPPRRVNLGLFSFEYKNMRYLPGTFGMKADELANLLNRAKDEYVGSIGHREETGRSL